MVGEQAAHGLPQRGEGRVGVGGLDRRPVPELLVLEPGEKGGRSCYWEPGELGGRSYDETMGTGREELTGNPGNWEGGVTTETMGTGREELPWKPRERGGRSYCWGREELLLGFE